VSEKTLEGEPLKAFGTPVADAQVDGRDPWIHRDKGMTCPTCMYFVQKDGGPRGRCRRHAPTMAGYPVVMPQDWCGDHKLG